jgi:hypothetical protein
MHLPKLLFLLLFAPPALAQTLTLSGADLLKPPAGQDFIVAKTPPSIDVLLLDDLPPGPRGTLWSSWGDGCLASNGRYYLGIGNHLDVSKGRGESRLYEYDPATKRLKLALNVRDLIRDEKVAAGKIHARIDEGKDGHLYFATYWGKIPTPEDMKAGFMGSALLRYDLRTGKAESLGVPVLGQGLPTSITDAQRMVMYAYAVKSQDFIAYDLERRRTLYRGFGDQQEGSRNIMLDTEGNAYMGTKDGRIARYDWKMREVRMTKATLPDASVEASSQRDKLSLRASTRAGSDGLIYGITHAGVMFALDPRTETVTDLGLNLGGGQYTAVMELSPDGKYLYYAPGAHGSATRIGTPIVQYDIARKQHKVLAFLNPPLRDKLNYNIGGTYNLKISPDGSALYATFNGAPLAEGARREETFGKPCVLILHIPRQERQ